MKSTKVQTLGSKCARLLFCKLGGLGRASSEGASCRLTQARLHLSGVASGSCLFIARDIVSQCSHFSLFIILAEYSALFMSLICRQNLSNQTKLDRHYLRHAPQR